MNYYKKKNNPLVRVLVVVLLAVLVLSLFGVFNKKSDDEWNEVTDLKWDYGRVQTGGQLIKFDDYLSTRYIEFDDGLLIDIDYSESCYYSIAFFDKDKNYLTMYEQVYGMPVRIERGQNLSGFYWNDDIAYFRVSISPIDEDGVIDWYEKLKYVNQIKIYTITLPEVEETE